MKSLRQMEKEAFNHAARQRREGLAEQEAEPIAFENVPREYPSFAALAESSEGFYKELQGRGYVFQPVDSGGKDDKMNNNSLFNATL